jgi:hypothetical protein
MGMEMEMKDEDYAYENDRQRRLDEKDDLETIEKLSGYEMSARIVELKQQLAEREKQIVMLRTAMNTAMQATREGYIYNFSCELFTEALTATKDLSGLVLCDAEPAMKVIRNEAGQIVTTDGDNGYFDVSNYIGKSFYLRKQP